MAKLATAILEDDAQRVRVLNLGGITQSWEVLVEGAPVPIVLGYARAEDYLVNPMYLGALVGRIAGRIGGAAFDWQGSRCELAANDGQNLLHGGSQGLSRQVWEMEADGQRRVRLRHVSNEGAGDWPGRVAFSVDIALEAGWLVYDMVAHTDRETPLSLTQHSYYNLSGGADIWDHRLHIPAAGWAEMDAALVATGRVEKLTGAPFDFREEKPVRDADPAGTGLDMCFTGVAGATRVRAESGLCLTLLSDQPCLQLYTGAGLRPRHEVNHRPFQGLCLEPQGYPNAVNLAGFPVSVAHPDRPYRHRLKVRVA